MILQFASPSTWSKFTAELFRATFITTKHYTTSAFVTQSLPSSIYTTIRRSGPSTPRNAFIGTRHTCHFSQSGLRMISSTVSITTPDLCKKEACSTLNWDHSVFKVIHDVQAPYRGNCRGSQSGVRCERYRVLSALKREARYCGRWFHIWRFCHYDRP